MFPFQHYVLIYSAPCIFSRNFCPPLVLHNTLWSDGRSDLSDTSAKSDMSEASPSASRLSGVQPDKRRNRQPSRNQERYRTAGRFLPRSRDRSVLTYVTGAATTARPAPAKRERSVNTKKDLHLVRIK